MILRFLKIILIVGDPCDNNFYYFTVAVHAAIRSEQLHADC